MKPFFLILALACACSAQDFPRQPRVFDHQFWEWEAVTAVPLVTEPLTFERNLRPTCAEWYNQRATRDKLIVQGLALKVFTGAGDALLKKLAPNSWVWRVPSGAMGLIYLGSTGVNLAGGGC